MPPVAVSVVIPNYNRGHLIGAAVESVLATTDVRIEVLVCDDGSSDSSETVVREFGDSRVRWLPGPRSGGPAVPRNRGIRVAQGDWIAFLDSDDTWLPGKLETQLAELRRTGHVACSTNALRCVPGDTEEASLMHASLPPTITLADQLSSNLVITSSMVVRAACLRQVGGFPEKSSRHIYEDYALWLRIAQTGPILALPLPLVGYRDDPATSIRGTMAFELRCTWNAFADFARWRASQNPAIETTWRERREVAKHLIGLVSARDMVSRAVRWREKGPAQHE